ncbi:hypothetical protein ACHQM5_004035 [Ranunculus cassubicifolius]
MAEGVVMELLGKLASLIDQQVNLLQGVSNEIREVKDEFESVNAFLRDADAKVDTDRGVEEWVRQVQDVAYEIEDVLDAYVLNHHSSWVGSTKAIYRGIPNFFRRLKVKHDIGNQLKDIKTRIQTISERRQRYNLITAEHLSTVSTRTVRDPREDALFLDEFQLIGIDGAREKMLEYLLEEDTRLGIISIYGMGGLGKTSLAKKVYDNAKVKHQFPLRAWITLSQAFNTKSLLEGLFRQLFPEAPGQKEMEVIELKQKLTEELRGKRYVVVLDDIWSLDAWKNLKNALPNDNKSCSRIIVTTRFENIPNVSCVEGCVLHPYPLQTLNPEDSWNLFYKTAFKSNGAFKSNDPNVNFAPKNLSKAPFSKFLDKCNGLPLGIVAIGGLLSTKPRNEWDQVYQSFGAFMDGSIASQVDDIRLVISFGYNDLPYHLKSCFLYLSLFPEDYSMKFSKLIRLWISEGFVKNERRPGMTMTDEEVAKLYLNELIQRSLVQVEASDDHRELKSKSCRIHDLVRDFIVVKANNLNFASVISDEQDEEVLRHSPINHSSNQPPRRLAISSSKHRDIGGNFLCESKKPNLQLRSLILFPRTKLIVLANPTRFRLLKILDLENAGLKEFPLQIGNLVSLRYLSLRDNKDLMVIPDFVGKLVRLKTLDFKGVPVPQFSNTLFHLRQLQNLLLTRYSAFQLGTLPAGIHKLAALQKLGRVDIKGSLVNELGMLTQLRKLCVMVEEKDVMQLFVSVDKLRFLRTLKVTLKISSSYPHWHRFSKSQTLCPPSLSLQSLTINGALYQLPPWISSLHNLQKLVLQGTKLENSPIEALQVLPNLVTLELGADVFQGKSLSISSQGFPSLKKFTIWLLKYLNEIKVEQGAMPVIQHIEFWRCLELKKVPLGIEYLTTLQLINNIESPIAFVEGLKKHHWETGHCPRISEKSTGRYTVY